MSELAFLPYFEEREELIIEPLTSFTISIKLKHPSIGTAMESVLTTLQEKVFGDIVIDYDNVIIRYRTSDGISYSSQDIEAVRRAVVDCEMQEMVREGLLC